MIRVVIAEDEKPARDRLSSFVREHSDLTIVGTTSDGEETVKTVDRVQPNLLFLDIQMPKGNGFDIINTVQHRPVVIFTTAFDEFAIDAFNVHALDYLLKPFSKERFNRSIALVRTILLDSRDYQLRTRAAMEEINSHKEYLQRVSVRKEHAYSIIPVEEIQCIKTSGGLVYIQVGDKQYQTDTTLNQFEKRLDPHRFMRIHRTAIVNLEQINDIVPWGQGRFAVRLRHGVSLQVSRDRIKNFKMKVGLKV